MEKFLEILEFPSNLGLIEPAPGKEPGVKKLPLWLRSHEFYDIVSLVRTEFLNPPAYSMDLYGKYTREFVLQTGPAIRNSLNRRAE